MISNTQFKKDYTTAIKVFRPILKKLNFRKQPDRDFGCVYLTDIPEVDFLKLDYFKLNVLVADIKCGGLFFFREKNGLYDCYFIISNELYEESIEKVKIVGIHEFCHFIALIYTYKSVSIRRQRKALLKRLQKKTDEMNIKNLDKFYLELQQQQSNTNSELNNEENKNDSFGIDYHTAFDDLHYRLNCEGDTCQYDILFKYFLFSKELFDEYFDCEKQSEFKWYLEQNDDANQIKAVTLFINTVVKVADEKSIPRKFAITQSIKFIKKYFA